MGTTAHRRCALFLVVVGAIAAGCGDTEPAERSAARWTTYNDVPHGLTVRVPVSWQRSRVSLTPYLTDPREVLSLGTFALRRGPAARCAQVPVAAMRAAGPRDVLLSLQERAGTSKPYTPRQRPFALGRPSQSEADACVGGRVPWRSHWVAFSDAGRSFYLLAIIGENVSPAKRRELRTVLESLRFTSRSGHHAPMASRDRQRHR